MNFEDTFTVVNPRELPFNPMEEIANSWMLISAGNAEGGYNTMTASWGHFGSMWGHSPDPGLPFTSNLPTAVVYIRPQRFTKQFVDRADRFTLSFFDKTYHEDLMYLGTHSGRDEDKIARTQLKPAFIDSTVSFEEARLIFVCRKLYAARLQPEGFITTDIVPHCYPEKDYHEMYVGEIIKVYLRTVQ